MERKIIIVCIEKLYFDQISVPTDNFIDINCITAHYIVLSRSFTIVKGFTKLRKATWPALHDGKEG